MIVSMPMFDFVELSAETDALWTAWAGELRTAGAFAPTLRHEPTEPLLEHWRRRDLLLSQTCGYPYRAALEGVAFVIGTFDYGCCEPGAPGHYRSLLVVPSGSQHGDDLRAYEGCRVAINNADSLSGCVSLGAALAEAGVGEVASVLETGAHVNSLAALQAGAVDLAAIDALSWSLLSGVRPGALTGLQVIGTGPLIPCPPWITTDGSSVTALQSAARGAVARLRASAPSTLDALRIRSFVALGPEHYAPTMGLARTAARVLPVALLEAS